MKAATILLFALLPLQWVGLGSTPLGQLRLHQVALFGFAAFVLTHYHLRTYAPVLRVAAVFVIANLYMAAAIAAVQFYQGGAAGAALQQLMYLAVFVAAGGLFYLLANGHEQHITQSLRLTGAVVCTSLIIGLSVAMLVNGVNPAGVLGRTIAAGDPEIFQKEVFKSAFAGFGLEDDRVAGNLRHEIFGFVLLSMLISTWAMRVGTRPARRQVAIYRAAMITGVVLLALSLSRSVLIAAAVWPLLVIVRSLRRAELSTRQVGILFASTAAVGALLLTGFGAVISNRFLTDTTGYESRANLYGEAFGALPDYWLLGGYSTVANSSHNFLLDTLLRNGIFAFLPALVIVATLLFAFVSLSLSLHRLPTALVPVVVALALPLVRAGTSGGGLIPPVEWLALGFVAGVVAAWRLPQRGATPPDRVRAPVAANV